MRKAGLLIVGAGPCGLGAALEMGKSGSGLETDFLLVDAGDATGGWARSHTTAEGFTADFGGHVLFPHKHYQEFADLLEQLPIQWASSTPMRGVQVENRFLPYPAQRNLQRLPLRRLARAMSSVVVRRRRRKTFAEDNVEGNLGGYLQNAFGGYITRLLMRPLNEKQWAYPAESLTDVWVKHRSGSGTRNVADMKLGRILRNRLLGRDDLGWTEDTKVSYPSHGGSGAIWQAVANTIPREKILLNTRVVSVSLVEKTALLSTGETVRWEHMLSTMPLDLLLRSIPEQPALAAKARQFVKARSRLFLFGVQGQMPARYRGLHSCQVTDEDVPFWRMNFPMTVSRGNGPEGCFSILCEVSEPADKPSRAAEELRASVEESLCRMGLVGGPEQQTVSRWEYTIEHGYPVPFLGRDALLAEVQPMLEKAGVYSRGRFGAWRYEISNQDHAFAQGTEAVRRILFGEAEETFGNAVEVNEAAQVVPASEPRRGLAVTFEAVREMMPI